MNPLYVQTYALEVCPRAATSKASRINPVAEWEGVPDGGNHAGTPVFDNSEVTP